MAGSEEVFPWLKSLPVAPEYRPSAAEFQDPIGYIFKIEKEASKYGICKIIPPVPPSPKKTAISNLNRSQPRFTTRQQQIGFCPRRPQPVRRPVWHSGHHYSFRDFEAKAKAFEKSYLKKGKKCASTLSPLEVETLYWKATADKPFSVEYANDMPGSAFAGPNDGGGGGDSVVTVGETAWNMRAVSRANGSLLRFMKEEIPGVTSPMVYVAMLFSWFAWHVEDHDLHSLNYLHMGAPKTWYGVPRDAAVAFEEVVRVHGYGGEINPLVTFAILGEKTTVMSPEVFISAGVPCCSGRVVCQSNFSWFFEGSIDRLAAAFMLDYGQFSDMQGALTGLLHPSCLINLLVQNAGEFVVTFPRAYHTGFSHGFNCGEAANIATPEWLRVAKDAAIRRASINYPPMVSHVQLLYDLGLALCSRVPGGMSTEPRSSRLKDKRKGVGETVIKELFVQDVLRNNDLLHVLGKGSSIVLLPRSSSDISVCSKLRVGSQQLKVNTEFSLNECNSEGMNSSKGFVHSVRMPREPAARYLMSADCSFFNDWTVGSGVTSNKFTVAHEDASIPKPSTYTGSSISSGWTKQNAGNDVYDALVESIEQQTQIADHNSKEDLNTERKKGNTALALLASAYGNSSDSEEDQGDSDIAADGDELNVMKHPSASRSQEIPCLPSQFQDYHGSPIVRLDGDDSPSESIGNYEYYMHKRVERIMSPFDYSVKSEDCNITSGGAFKNNRAVPYSTMNCSQDTHAVTSLMGKTAIPIDNKNVSLGAPSDEDSSRMHVFCLEHAAEAEQQLRPIGGAHILLLCHPDYPKIEAEAKFMAEELGIDYMWKNTVYRHANREDEERIQSSLDSEEAIPGNGDWAVKLGINLFYSANLSRSPLYSKQMPYNSVIYNAFGRSTPSSSPIEPKVYQRRANKQKKVVAGKWCGKVWMSNQVHPLLAKRDSEDVEDEKSLHGWSLPDEKLERSEITHKSNTTIKKSGRKRKMTVESGEAREGSIAERDWLSDDSIEDKSNQSRRKILRSKRTRHIERDDTASEGDYSPLQHHRKPISKRAKCIESSVSDDSLDDNTHIQHWRKANAKEAKFIDSDVVSDDTMDYDSDWAQRGELSDKQDVFSEDSLDVGSLQLQRKTPKSKYDQYIAEEDVISNDETEVYFQKQKGRISKSRNHKFLSEKETVISDDQLEHHMQKQQQRHPKSRQDKYLAGENIISDDQLEGHCRKYQRRIPKDRQAKCVTGEDVVSDDQLDDHFQKPQRNVRRSRQNKYNDREVVDDSTENNSHLLYRTPKRKQAKCMDEDSVNSDDQVEDDSHQQHRRTLRSKQSKPQLQTLKHMKQANPLRVRSKTSRPVKRGALKLMKSKAPRQMKQQPCVWNSQSGNSRDETLHIEEEEEGGPSTRLRKRVPKIQKESEGKSKEKETKKKKVKNATAAKVSAGRAKVKDEEGEYQCDIEGCNMSFGSKQELVHHKRNICPVKGCGKKFFSHKYLVQHRRVHEDDRPLKCPWKGCKMTFKWAWARTEHIRVHTGARPYVCAETGCGQTFRFVSDFSRHKRKTGHSTKKNR
ncbi:Zinc finger C2H2-type [Sesbania bispinosa]|nr:Zinc finger C2H2-type [Sesbania bispinosa]